MTQYALVTASAFLLMFSANSAAFNLDKSPSSEEMVELYSESGSLQELNERDSISNQRYQEYLALGLTPDTHMELTYKRLASVHAVNNSSLGAGDTEATNNELSERQERWQVEEDGFTYEYLEIERYFEGTGWKQIHLSRKLIE